MKLEDYKASTIIEDGIEYNYIEFPLKSPFPHISKDNLERLAKEAKGYWKIKYKNRYSYIKDGSMIKEIANNRVYHIIQVYCQVFDLVPIHKEYGLTKDYEYSQIEYVTDFGQGEMIAHLIYFKNGLRHNDMGFAEYNTFSNFDNQYWIDGVIVTTEYFKNYKRTKLIDDVLKNQ